MEIPFSIPLNATIGLIGTVTARAQFVSNIPVESQDYSFVVLIKGTSNNPAGLYVFQNQVWQLAVPYDPIDDFVISGGSIEVYVDITASATPPSGSTVYRNGVQSTATSVTPATGVIWAAIKTNPTSGGVSGVASFNTRTGAVTLTQADVAAVLPIASSTVLGGVKAGTNVAVAGDGTLSVATGAGLTAGTNVSITSGVINVPTGAGYVLPAATSSVIGGVKAGTNVTIAGDGTLNVPTGAGYALPVATSSVLGGVKVGANVTIAGDGTLSLTTANITGAGGATSASPTFTGTMTAAAATFNGNFILNSSYAFASLPAAAAGLKGMRTYITDGAATPALGAAAAGGGTLFTPVYCDGTTWRNG